jgi:hypothetical protein
MKENITAIISFLGGIGWGLFGVFILFDEGINEDSFFPILALLTTAISIILYVLWTKFGKREFSELDRMDCENQLIKLQIEQKELKKKLEE